MNESLASRVGRIISGSVNALVDTVENMAPDSVMEQAIREVDGAIDEVRAELGKVLANKHLANSRLVEESRKHDDLGAKIELAIGEGRDDLAEAAIAKQLDVEAQIPILEATITDLGDKEKEFEAYVRALQGKKREMQEELRQFRESRVEANSPATTGSLAGATKPVNASARADKAASAFDRIMEKATGLAANGRGAEFQDAAKLAELEDLVRKNRIQERLNEIKSRKSN